MLIFGGRRRRRRRRCRCDFGPLLIALGVGVFTTYLIPNHILIALLGLALIAAGARFCAT